MNQRKAHILFSLLSDFIFYIEQWPESISPKIDFCNLLKVNSRLILFLRPRYPLKYVLIITWKHEESLVDLSPFRYSRSPYAILQCFNCLIIVNLSLKGQWLLNNPCGTTKWFNHLNINIRHLYHTNINFQYLIQ
jgi:hypothetical protein